jgi:hypothetical protein
MVKPTDGSLKNTKEESRCDQTLEIFCGSSAGHNHAPHEDMDKY